MTPWTHPPELVRFAQFLAREEEQPSASDEEFIAQVRATYWGTNCWSWVEMSFAIIAAACAQRPHLALELIADPIDVMIQGGLTDENDVIAQRVAVARKERPYVPLTDAGRTWLLENWPGLEEDAKVILRRKWIELTQ
jgi:hypothetical protein